MMSMFTGVLIFLLYFVSCSDSAVDLEPKVQNAGVGRRDLASQSSTIPNTLSLDKEKPEIKSKAASTSSQKQDTLEKAKPASAKTSKSVPATATAKRYDPTVWEKTFSMEGLKKDLQRVKKGETRKVHFGPYASIVTPIEIPKGQMIKDNEIEEVPGFTLYEGAYVMPVGLNGADYPCKARFYIQHDGALVGSMHAVIKGSKGLQGMQAIVKNVDANTYKFDLHPYESQLTNEPIAETEGKSSNSANQKDAGSEKAQKLDFSEFGKADTQTEKKAPKASTSDATPTKETSIHRRRLNPGDTLSLYGQKFNIAEYDTYGSLQMGGKGESPSAPPEERPAVTKKLALLFYWEHIAVKKRFHGRTLVDKERAATQYTNALRSYFAPLFHHLGPFGGDHSIGLNFIVYCGFTSRVKKHAYSKGNDETLTKLIRKQQEGVWDEWHENIFHPEKIIQRTARRYPNEYIPVPMMVLVKSALHLKEEGQGGEGITGQVGAYFDSYGLNRDNDRTYSDNAVFVTVSAHQIAGISVRDITAVAHELGHAFGAAHTHSVSVWGEACPDSCAQTCMGYNDENQVIQNPDRSQYEWWFKQPDNEAGTSSNLHRGSIMSYCDVCHSHIDPDTGSSSDDNLFWPLRFWQRNLDLIHMHWNQHVQWGMLNWKYGLKKGESIGGNEDEQGEILISDDARCFLHARHNGVIQAFVRGMGGRIFWSVNEFVEGSRLEFTDGGIIRHMHKEREIWADDGAAEKCNGKPCALHIASTHRRTGRQTGCIIAVYELDNKGEISGWPDMSRTVYRLPSESVYNYQHCPHKDGVTENPVGCVCRGPYRFNEALLTTAEKKFCNGAIVFGPCEHTDGVTEMQGYGYCGCGSQICHSMDDHRICLGDESLCLSHRMCDAAQPLQVHLPCTCATPDDIRDTPYHQPESNTDYPYCNMFQVWGNCESTDGIDANYEVCQCGTETCPEDHACTLATSTCTEVVGGMDIGGRGSIDSYKSLSTGSDYDFMGPRRKQPDSNGGMAGGGSIPPPNQGGAPTPNMHKKRVSLQRTQAVFDLSVIRVLIVASATIGLLCGWKSLQKTLASEESEHLLANDI